MKNKKKIAFFSNTLNYGGIEKALVNLLNSLSKKYQIDLFLEKKEGDYLSQINSNINVKEYKLSYSKNVLFRKIYNFSKRIMWIVRNYNKYDFSCCYATYSVICSKLSLACSKNNSIYIHSNYCEKFNYEENNIKTFFNKRNLKKFKTIFFVSNESREDLIKCFPIIKNRSYTINNIVDSDKIINGSKQKIDINKNNSKIFCFVGRIDNESKNMNRLIMTFKNVKIDYELWIIGDGPDYNKTKKLIEDNQLTNKIKMLGKKTNVYPYIKNCDFIILTSDYEGFPVTYYEAIILNKPIISTIDVSDEYISINNNFGFIVEKDYKKISNFINNKLDLNFKSKRINIKEINNERIKKIEEFIDNNSKF